MHPQIAVQRVDPSPRDYPDGTPASPQYLSDQLSRSIGTPPETGRRDVYLNELDARPETYGNLHRRSRTNVGEGVRVV